MPITFHDRYQNVWGMAFFDASTGLYTQRGTAGNVYNVDLFSDTGVAVDDAIVIGIGSVGSLHGKADELLINLDVPMAATAMTGVWEYSVGGSNAVPNWQPLTGVVDGTAGFTVTGAQTITWDLPDDWDNFQLTSVGAYIYYQFLIRYRITSLTGLTEGGHLANVTSSLRFRPWSIFVTGFVEATPCTMDDIYNADVTGGWGVVQKNGSQFSFTCNLLVDPSCYVSSQNEQIFFETNWFIIGSGTWLCGEIVSGDKTRHGTDFVFLGKNVNYPGNQPISTNSKIYNSRFRIIRDVATKGFNGYWGMGMGSEAGQVFYDVFFQNFRNLPFSNQDNVIMNVSGTAIVSGQIEPPGAILRNINLYGVSHVIRTQSQVGRYIHESDLGNATVAPINSYQAQGTNLASFIAVDCTWGTFADTNKVRWNISAVPTYQNSAVYEMYSVLLRLVNEQNVAISGATATLKDVNGTTVFAYTSNTDGIVGVDSGTLSGVAAGYIQDSTKSWGTDQYRDQEVLITSGSGINQRRILKRGNTATQIDSAWDFTVTPAVGDRYSIVPYVIVKKFEPTTYGSGGGLYWSTTTSYGPFTLTIAKSGYKTIKKKFDLVARTDWTITMVKVKDINLSKSVKVFNN